MSPKTSKPVITVNDLDDTTSLMNMKEAPKCSIEIRFLISITQDPKKSSELTITFAAYHAI
jgi:hypothetical protein